PKSPGVAATDVLEKFLAAKTLTERLTLIETQIPESELAKTCLMGALPPTSKIELDAQQTDSAAPVVDHFFHVDFAAASQPIPSQTLVVRTRGTAEPKVLVEPFLDSFGGRLAAFAKAPTSKTGVFQVTVSAVAACNDENVPERAKKLTLKLLPGATTQEIARAYFSRQSKITAMLEGSQQSLSYGEAKICTVMLRWNAKENPASPYLEALSIKPLAANP
ncbi:MAG: hypothetical protein ACRDBP_05375, partial [Luteolibacter sp.]